MTDKRDDRIDNLVKRVNDIVYGDRNEIPSEEMSDGIIALTTAAGRAIGELAYACDNDKRALDEIINITSSQMKIEAKTTFEKISQLNETAGEMAGAVK